MADYLKEKLPAALINRVQFLPGESLPSLVGRLTLLNYYHPSGIINALLMPGIRDKHLLRPPASPDFFRNLSAISLLDPVGLYAASAHPLAVFFTQKEHSLEHLVLEGHKFPILPQSLMARHIRLVSTAQYCPYCLQEGLYHRHIWLPVAVSACIKHRAILRNTCPNCQRPVSIRSIIKNECANCKADLMNADAVRIDEDKFGLSVQKVIQTWLAHNNSHNVGGLPNQPPKTLFRIVEGIRLSLMNHQDVWPFFPRLNNLSPLSKGQKLSPQASFALYSAAFAALYNWPTGFHKFLETYAKANAEGTLHKNLPGLYSQWIQYRWQEPRFQFLQTAFDEYVVKYHAPSASVFMTARYQNNKAFMDRLGYTTVKEAVKQLGLSKAIVTNLINEGVLTTERPPGSGSVYKWLINKQSLEAFLKDIQRFSHYGNASDFTVGLRDASKMLASVGLNAAKIIIRVSQNSLTAALSSKRLEDLRFKEQDIQVLAQKIRQENGWITRMEFAQKMGVKPVVLSKWIDAGVVKPLVTYANAQYFALGEVEDFIKNHIFSDEAAKILGVGVDVVQKWTRKGRLKSLVGGNESASHRYLFRRSDVERLRPENRLTAPQMAKKLGISRSQMFVWIKQGKIRPISGPGIDRCKHYLFTTAAQT